MALSKEEKKDRMLNGDVRRAIIAMALPTIAAQLITVFYGLVDTYFVSTLGTSATAAVGVNGSLERSISMIGTLIGGGASSYISRCLGMKNNEGADRVLSTSVFTGMGAGAILMVLGLCFTGPMVDFLGANESCRIYSMQYATYVLMAAPFMVGSFVLNMALRSEGSATFAMVGIGFGAVLNCFLDPLFIISMGLGVVGASMATAISKLVSFGILIYMYVTRKSLVNLSIRKVKYIAAEVAEVLKIGSASLFRTLCMLVGAILINRIAGSISTSALAAMSVTNRVMEFPFAVVLGFGMGYQPVAGFNWGARKFGRVRDSLNFSTKVSIAGGLIMGALIIIFRAPITALFNSESDPEVLRICYLSMVTQSAALVCHTFLSIQNMFYAAIGRAKAALALSTARQGTILIPMILLLSYLFGINGLASAQAVADVLSLFLSVPLAIKARRLITEEENKLLEERTLSAGAVQLSR